MSSKTAPTTGPHPQRRRTRIVCISDTHNQTPHLPKGDVLIHAGDLTNQGTYSELKKTVAWLEKTDFEVKIVVAGNHDITLDQHFYGEYWRYFHNQQRQEDEGCRALFENSGITYLEHEALDIKLASENGPRTHFKVFGSPYSPAHGLWGFGYEPEDAPKLWDAISDDIDLLITHTPPKEHCDKAVPGTNRVGCEALRRKLWSVRPALHVCGHMHEGRGVERVTWRNDLPFGESELEIWNDPGAGIGSKKLSLLDLTSRAKTEWTSYTSRPSTAKDVSLPAAPAPARKAEGVIRFSGTQNEPPTEDELAHLVKDIDSQRKRLAAHTIHRCQKNSTISDLAARSGADSGSSGIVLNIGGPFGVPSAVSFTHHSTCKSTCIVNAAIKRNSYGGPGGVNKPIVVDIDLPIWNP